MFDDMKLAKVPILERNIPVAKVPGGCQDFPTHQRAYGPRRDTMDEPRRSFQERLSAFAEDERRKAHLLPEGPEKDLALLKVSQAETAAHLDQLASIKQELP
jgi:hypothetical protein